MNGHLEGGSHNPILRGQKVTMAINHLQIMGWDIGTILCWDLLYHNPNFPNFKFRNLVSSCVRFKWRNNRRFLCNEPIRSMYGIFTYIRLSFWGNMDPMGNDVFMKLRILTPQSSGVILKTPKHPCELQVQTFPSKDSSGEAKLDMCFWQHVTVFVNFQNVTQQDCSWHPVHMGSQHGHA